MKARVTEEFKKYSVYSGFYRESDPFGSSGSLIEIFECKCFIKSITVREWNAIRSNEDVQNTLLNSKYIQCLWFTKPTGITNYSLRLSNMDQKNHLFGYLEKLRTENRLPEREEFESLKTELKLLAL